MEDIRLLVQEEGRDGRIAFNVPVAEQTPTDIGKSSTKKPPTSPRPHLEIKKEDASRPTKRSTGTGQPGSRVRSASTGRDKKSELQARYWAFLFGNLQRAVDEIYQTCETDESITECKEVMMVLDNYTRDFHNLIEWFKIKWEYETTAPPQRPTSLAWEVRRSSPGKVNVKYSKTSKKYSLDDVATVVKPLTFDRMQSEKIIKEEDKKQIEKVIRDSKIQSEKVIKDKDDKNQSQQVIKDDKTQSEKIMKEDKNQQIIRKQSGDDLKEEEDNSEKVTINYSLFPAIIPDADPPCNVSNATVEMIDEVCQTDREEDVDENGPKYRTASQQTCPELTGESPTFKSKVSPPIKSTYSSAANLKSTVTKTVIQTRNVLTTAAAVASKVKTSTTTTGVPQRLPWGVRKPPLKLQRSSTVAEVKPSSTNSRVVTKSSPRTVLGPKQPCSTATGPLQPRCMKNVVNKDSKLNTSKDAKQNMKQSSSKLSSRLSGSFGKTSTRFPNASSVSLSETTPEKKEDDDGWVQVRSRSRFSPGKIESLDPFITQSATNLKTKIERKGSFGAKAFNKCRFNQPSSAMSLPLLTLDVDKVDEKMENSKDDYIKEEEKATSIIDKTILSLKKTEIKKKIIQKEKTDKNIKDNKPIPLKINKDKKTNEENSNKKSKDDKMKIDKTVDLKNSQIKEIKNKEKQLEETKAETEDRNNKIDEIKFNKENISDFEMINNVKNRMKNELIDDEEENNFDEEMKKNAEAEELLKKEISELESTDVELDMETGDEETDGEATTGTEDEHDSDKKIRNLVVKQLEREPSPKRQNHYESLMNGMSWADQMSTLDELEKLVVQDCSKKGMSQDEQKDTLDRLGELVARYPGRALELHQKLSSPSRRRTFPDNVNRLEARQAKASEKRERLINERAQRLRDLLNKVDEVKAAKDKLIGQRRQRLDMKLKRATENRTLHLKEIMRKAHDEEEKLKEIAFINELEAQNKRHDFMAQCQEQEGRLQEIHEGRQRKQEEKAAKEAAAEERRKALEAERQEKLEKMQERQRKRDEQADKKKQEKEKERLELAREKARDRSERLEALHAAQLEAQEELQKKIQLKQEESARRHEENIEQIRQKALELSILKCSDDVAPRLAPYDKKKLCSACNVLIGSEVFLLSHLRGPKHLNILKSQNNGRDLSKDDIEKLNMKTIITAPEGKVDPKIVERKERIKWLKKKCKKIRMRMSTKGETYVSKLENEQIDSQNKIKLQKCFKHIDKLMTSQGIGQWCDKAVTELERAMSELIRTLTKQTKATNIDQDMFRCLDGFKTLCNILQLDLEVPANMPPYLPPKCFETCCLCFLSALNNSKSNCKYVLLSNKVIVLLDLLCHRLTKLLPDDASFELSNEVKLPVDKVAGAAMKAITMMLNNVDSNSCEVHDYNLRIQDVLSYTVSIGIVDKLAKYCENVRDPVEDNAKAISFLLDGMDLLAALINKCGNLKRGKEDPTQLLPTLQATELVGVVSIVYSMLLHQDTPPREEGCKSKPKATLPQTTINVAMSTFKLLHSVAVLDIHLFQSMLGAEGISLQFRHIASYLLWYCGLDKCNDDLLQEVIRVVGFFAVHHYDNQMMLQSGHMPVLQQLLTLPYEYVTNSDEQAVLFPTLLACCAGNQEIRVIIEKDLIWLTLENFKHREDVKGNLLLALVDSQKQNKNVS